MKVGLLTTSFPRREDDVPGRFVLGFARALAARGAHVEVLAPEPAEPLAPPRWPSVDVHWVRYLPKRAWQSTFYGAGVLDNLRDRPSRALGLAPFVAAMSVEARKRADAWDAVVSHWAVPNALIAAQLRPLRHLAVLHSADVFVLERLPLRAQLARVIASSADELLFSSRELRTRFLALLEPLKRADAAARCHVCAMGIDPTAGGATARETRAGLHVLSLGRLIALKGIEHAIEAVAGLPDTQLTVVGDGPDRARLAAYARQRGADVRFTGALYGADKEACFREADVFVLPSIVLPSGRTEGMPTTVLEAMDHGLPVVASDVGGVRDVVEPGSNGSLVEPGQASALRAALQALRDPALRAKLSLGARETAALYHWENLGPHLWSLTFGDD